VPYQAKLENGSTATFLVPGSYDPQTVFDSGYLHGGDGAVLSGPDISKALGFFGTFDLQRNAGKGNLATTDYPPISSDYEWLPPTHHGMNTFYPAYTAASNFNVGMYLGGAGYSEKDAMDIANRFAHSMSSNAGAPEQIEMWKAGWQAAQSMKTTRLRPPPSFPSYMGKQGDFDGASEPWNQR
jgi:hypothetical protein